MKRAGVKTGMPIWEAVRLCPQAVFVKRDFRWYEVLSRCLLQVVRHFSPRVEFYSIDECFFEAIPARGQTLQELAESLRGSILQTVHVPVTVGIGRTKTLAKLISDSAKPFGALALTDPDAERALLDQLPVTEVSGIAQRRAARLEPYGIHTCLDSALADRLLIRRLLTRTGEALWYKLNGEAILPVYTEQPPVRGASSAGDTPV